VQAVDPVLETAVRQYFEESDRSLAALLGRSLPWVSAATPSRTDRQL
jgi:hypothetical protein